MYIKTGVTFLRPSHMSTSSPIKQRQTDAAVAQFLTADTTITSSITTPSESPHADIIGAMMDVTLQIFPVTV